MFAGILVTLILFGCQKDTVVDQLAIPDSPEISTRMVSGSWNVSLTNFRYVWQNRVPTGWNNDSNYGTYSGYCSYPMYTGSYSFNEGPNTNLCGIASYMMGVNLVSHPALMDVPYGTNDRAIRLVEYAKRYKIFDTGYSFGNFCYIYSIYTMGSGSGTKKGDFTNWSNCSQYTYPGTSWGGTTNRETAKSFIYSKISASKPCVALIRVNAYSGCSSADCSSYISTSSSIGTGHMVLITGLTINETTGIHKIRFKDPWSNNSKTYEIIYADFLNSMLAASTSSTYNVFSIDGN